jgi:hypothetical protein
MKSGAPEGRTQFVAVFVIVRVFVPVVLIFPFVRSRLPETSISPFRLISSPEALSISRLLKLFEPVKSPSIPPSDWAVEPENFTVALAPVPLTNDPVLYLSIVPYRVSDLLLMLLSRAGPSIKSLLHREVL